MYVALACRGCHSIIELYLYSSLAVHPDKITIATGQVAGHDKKEGRVGRLSHPTLDYNSHLNVLCYYPPQRCNVQQVLSSLVTRRTPYDLLTRRWSRGYGSAIWGVVTVLSEGLLYV